MLEVHRSIKSGKEVKENNPEASDHEQISNNPQNSKHSSPNWAH